MSDSAGKYIAALREEKGMSQRELSRRTGLGNATISRIEAGEGNPGPDTLVKIADALSIPVDELMLRCKYTSIPEPFIVMARKTGALTEQQRAYVYSVLDQTIDRVLGELEHPSASGDEQG